MFRDPSDDAQPKLHRVELTGLALVDVPYRDEPTERIIVHFGPEFTDPADFQLYAAHPPSDVWPFFYDSRQQRGLGIAPLGSPDDYFEDEIVKATDPLNAEHQFAPNMTALYVFLVDTLGDLTDAGIDNYFRIVANKTPLMAGDSDYEKVLGRLRKIREDEGDDVVIRLVQKVARYDWRAIMDAQKALREEVTL